jgi:hypothetical protein
MKPVALLFLFFLSCCASSALERSLGKNMEWQRHSRKVQEWFIHQWREQGFAVGKVSPDFLKYLIEELDYVGEPFKKPGLEIRPYDLAIVMLEWDKGGFGMVRYRTANGDIVIQTLDSTGNVVEKLIKLRWVGDVFRPRRSTQKAPKLGI